MSTTLIAIEDMTMLRAAVIENRTNNSVFAGMKAMMIEQLKEKMRNGVAHFVYLKKDGSLREAFGTLNRALIDNYINNSGVSREKYQCTAYFDIQACGFRSFRWENIVSIL